jgi:hypothetical protein
MSQNLTNQLINTLKNLFVPREKKLVPVKVYANNNRFKTK